MEYRDYYKEEITKYSYQELVSYASWMNERFGNFPMIVGGWAVYFYTRGLGSRDIDTVFLSRNLLHDTLKYYFFSHGYEGHGRFVKEYFKEIKTEGETFRVYLDACSTEDKNLFQSDSSKEIHWSLCFKYAIKKEIEKDVFIYIPRIEVLYLLKGKGLMDRVYRHKRADITEKEYLTSKIWKDAWDLDTLRDLEKINENFLTSLLKETGVLYMFSDLEKIKRVYL